MVRRGEHQIMKQVWFPGSIKTKSTPLEKRNEKVYLGTNHTHPSGKRGLGREISEMGEAR